MKSEHIHFSYMSGQWVDSNERYLQLMRRGKMEKMEYIVQTVIGGGAWYDHGKYDTEAEALEVASQLLAAQADIKMRVIGKQTDYITIYDSESKNQYTP